jgi:hypothetical protein
MAKLCPFKSRVRGRFQVTAALSGVIGFGRAMAHWNRCAHVSNIV